MYDGNVKRRYLLCLFLLYLGFAGTGQAAPESVSSDIPVEDPPLPTFRESKPYFPPQAKERRPLITSPVPKPVVPRQSVPRSPSLSPVPQPVPSVKKPTDSSSRHPVTSKRADGGDNFFLVLFILVVLFIVYKSNTKIFGLPHERECYRCHLKFNRGYKKYEWLILDGAMRFVCLVCYKCQICEVQFGERSRRQEWQFDDGRKVICLRCHTKLENKIRDRKFDEWLESTKEKSTTPNTTRERIQSAVKREVWRRDQGKCVECGISENLEFDHIIPVSKGGANTVRNLQLLCESCNRSKSANIQ